MGKATREQLYEILTGDDEGRVCRDIPDSACRHQPSHFLSHVVALGLTKVGDGLADAKLILSWLIGALGAPAALVGLLVPIREAGALLPQLVIAAGIRRQPVRKWFWVAGSVVQGIAVIGMGMVALTGSGAEAGWMIVGLLGLLALARSACSVAYKDVLGKTVSKATRGTATGTAKTAAAAVILGLGVLLALEILPTTLPVIGSLLIFAGLVWLSAAALFASLHEEPGATEGGGNALSVALQQWQLLFDDPQLRRFILTRALLIATALGPPFLLVLGGRDSGPALGELGLFVVASGLADLSSSYFWGRLSDRSSRQVLMLAGLIGASALAAACGIAVLAPRWLQWPALLPGLLFVILIAHQGVRLGRSTHIVDMASAEQRASYTALSNTIIGLVLLGSGLFSLIANHYGLPAVIGVLALFSLAGAWAARGLEEVQAD